MNIREPGLAETVYDLRTTHLPTLTPIQHCCVFLLRLPSIGSMPLVHRLLRRTLGLRQDTQFLRGFHCFAGQLVCGQHVSLCNTFFEE